MSDKSKIEWTDATWNPIRGCSVVSEGCRNCYAMAVAARFSGEAQAYEGLAYRNASGAHWTGKVQLVEKHLDDPLKWKTPRRIFVNSMSDLFHENVRNTEIALIFQVMSKAKQHTFQILTKRPKRMLDFMKMMSKLNEACTNQEEWPLPNVWLGVSVEDQKTADERIPLLLQTPAAVRWLSCEPLLEAVNLNPYLRTCATCGTWHPATDFGDGHKFTYSDIEWVVVGGESGTGARPFDIQWAQSIINQCRADNVPVFMKQVGSNAWNGAKGLSKTKIFDRKGGDINEWPEDLRVREFPA
jgi:protein gp37